MLSPPQLWQTGLKVFLVDRTILTVQYRQKIVVKITLMRCAKFYLRGDHNVSHAKFPVRFVIRR